MGPLGEPVPTRCFDAWTRGMVSLFLVLALTSCGLFKPKTPGEGAATSYAGGRCHRRLRRASRVSPRAEIRDTLFDPLDTIKHDGLHARHRRRRARFFLELFYRKNGYTFVERQLYHRQPQDHLRPGREGRTAGHPRATSASRATTITTNTDELQAVHHRPDPRAFPGLAQGPALRRHRRAKGHGPRAAVLPLGRVSQRAGGHAHRRHSSTAARART